MKLAELLGACSSWRRYWEKNYQAPAPSAYASSSKHFFHPLFFSWSTAISSSGYWWEPPALSFLGHRSPLSAVTWAPVWFSPAQAVSCVDLRPVYIWFTAEHKGGAQKRFSLAAVRHLRKYFPYLHLTNTYMEFAMYRSLIVLSFTKCFQLSVPQNDQLHYREENWGREGLSKWSKITKLMSRKSRMWS